MIVIEKRGKWFVKDNDGIIRKFHSRPAAEAFAGVEEEVVEELVEEVTATQGWYENDI
jgi:hypothetical protein